MSASMEHPTISNFESEHDKPIKTPITERLGSVMNKITSRDFWFKERTLGEQSADDGRAMRMAKNMLRASGTLGKVAFETSTRLTGTKVLFDLPLHLLQRHDVKRSKGEILKVMSGEGSYVEKKSQISEILNSASMAKKLSPEEIESFHTALEQASMDEYESEQAYEKTLDTYLRAKTSGMQVVREGLNSLFVASGAQMLRAGSMLTLKGVETYQDSKRESEIKGGKAGEVFRSKFKEGVLKTVTLGLKSTEQNRSGWKKFADTAQAFGTIATIFGIGSSAMNEFNSGSTSENLSKLFDRLEHDGAASFAGQNMEQNAQRMMDMYGGGGIFRQIKNAITSATDKIFSTSLGDILPEPNVQPTMSLDSRNTDGPIDFKEKVGFVRDQSGFTPHTPEPNEVVSAGERVADVKNSSPDSLGYDRVRDALITPRAQSLVENMPNSSPAPASPFTWEPRSVNQFMDDDDVFSAKRSEADELAIQAEKAGVPHAEALVGARKVVYQDLIEKSSPYSLRKMGFYQQKDGTWTHPQIDGSQRVPEPFVQKTPQVEPVVKSGVKPQNGFEQRTPSQGMKLETPVSGFKNPENSAYDSLIKQYGKTDPGLLKASGFTQRTDGSWTYPDDEPQVRPVPKPEPVAVAPKKPEVVDADTVRPRKVVKGVASKVAETSVPTDPKQVHQELIKAYKDSAPDILEKAGYFKKPDGTWTHSDLEPKTESLPKSIASIRERIEAAHKRSITLEGDADEPVSKRVETPQPKPEPIVVTPKKPEVVDADTVRPRKVVKGVASKVAEASAPTDPKQVHQELIKAYKDSAPDILEKAGYFKKPDGTWTHSDLEPSIDRSAIPEKQSISERIKAARRRLYEISDEE